MNKAELVALHPDLSGTLAMVPDVAEMYAHGVTVKDLEFSGTTLNVTLEIAPVEFKWIELDFAVEKPNAG